ncbi:MAG: T9SS type A sorting domain-containing protein, partial [Candidatus Krumholzibacteria bacterium]|nr:T9SS type A sorting domain-containing protein [Candidatus Krumholzibacteria bacterium]
SRWEVPDLMNTGRDEVQVMMEVAEYGYVWGWTGNDGYPAPYYDNVIIKIYPYNGPGMSARELDMAQDNFPARGTIDMGDPGSHSVRFDMANNISLAAHLRNDPGDSMVVDINPVRTGAGFDGFPTLHYILDRNPIFDAYRTAGMPDMGFAVGDSAVGISGSPTPGKWAFDLPDTGFLFPGDVLHYYISATDALGGVGGSDPQTSLMPADTTGFSTGFGDPMGYNSTFVIHALPSISDGAGAHPGILFLNDFANRGGENEWYTALNNIGLLVGEDYDVYYTNGPSSGVGNGIGGRASHLMLTGYDDILYTSGNLGVNTIANGDFENDAGDDVGTLMNWLDIGGKDIFLTGDDLASDMAQAGTATLAFLEQYMGVGVITFDIRSFIGNQMTPMVRVIGGNPVFGGTLQTWIAYGGCFGINTFDGVNVIGTGQRLAEFVDPNGGDYGYAAAALNVMESGSRAVSMTVDLMYVYTDPVAPGNLLPGRAQLLKDVLAYFNVAGLPQNVSPVLPGITFQTSNYPNPFNPSTTIKYSMPQDGHLKLSIFNVRGQLVKTLIDGVRPAGADQAVVWDGSDNQDSSVSSGVYFYEARIKSEVKIGKMTLLK